MAKKMTPNTRLSTMPNGAAPSGVSEASTREAMLDYDLVGDVVFDPPLSPEELRQRFGFGIPIEERIEQAKRQIAAGEDEW